MCMSLCNKNQHKIEHNVTIGNILINAYNTTMIISLRCTKHLRYTKYLSHEDHIHTTSIFHHIEQNTLK